MTPVREAGYVHGEATVDPADDDRFRTLAQTWFDRAAELLLPELANRIERHDPTVRSVVAIRATDDVRVATADYRPGQLAALASGLADRTGALSLEIHDSNARHDPLLARIAVEPLTTDSCWIRMLVDVKDDRRWGDFLAAALDKANPSFGIVTDDNLIQATSLDVALRRSHLVSAQESRSWLRGYSWITICPAELVERIGGADSLVTSGAFAHVHQLSAGGVILQATETLAEYDEAAMRRTFHLLAPVLPRGAPRPLPGRAPGKLVYEDAANIRPNH